MNKISVETMRAVSAGIAQGNSFIVIAENDIKCFPNAKMAYEYAKQGNHVTLHVRKLCGGLYMSPTSN